MVGSIRSLSSSSHKTTSHTSVPQLTEQDKQLIGAIIARISPEQKSKAAFLEARDAECYERGVDVTTVPDSLIVALDWQHGRTWQDKWTSALNYQTDVTLPSRVDSDMLSMPDYTDDKSRSDIMLVHEHAQALLRQKQRAEAEDGGMLFHRPSSSPMTSTPPRQSRAKPPAEFVTSTPRRAPRMQEYLPQEGSSRDMEEDQDSSSSDDELLELQLKADLFRRGKIWDRWRAAYYEEIEGRTAAHDRDPGGQIYRRMLQRRVFWRWYGGWSLRQKRYRKMEAVHELRYVKKPFDLWRQRAAQKAERKYHERLLAAHDRVQAKSEGRVLRLALEHWKRALAAKRAAKVDRGLVLRRHFERWQSQYARTADLEELADTFYRRHALRKSLRVWRYEAALRDKQSQIVRRIDSRLKGSTWVKWVESLHNARIADEIYATRLRKTAFAFWVHQKSRLAKLERRADKFAKAALKRSAKGMLSIWKARKAEKDFRLLSAGKQLLVWRRRQMQRQHTDAARVDAVQLRVRDAAVRSAFGRWTTKLQRLRHLETSAEFGRGVLLLARGLAKWRQQIASLRRLEAKADAFYSAGTAADRFVVWRDQLLAKRLQTACNEYMAVKDQQNLEIIFSSWLTKTREKRSLKQRETTLATRRDQRLRKAALKQWTSRVIQIKDDLFTYGQRYDQQRLQQTFVLWRAAYQERLELREKLAVLRSRQEARLIKSSFKTMRLAYKGAKKRERRLERFERKANATVLINAWSRWHRKAEEARLQRAYATFLQHRVEAVLRSSFTRWKGQTRALPAVAYHAYHLKKDALALWRDKLPLQQQYNIAVRKDRQKTLGRIFTSWKNLRREKYAIRQATRFRSRPSGSSESLISRSVRAALQLTSSSSSEEELEVRRPVASRASLSPAQSVKPRESDALRIIRERIARVTLGGRSSAPPSPAPSTPSAPSRSTPTAPPRFRPRRDSDASSLSSLRGA